MTDEMKRGGSSPQEGNDKDNPIETIKKFLEEPIWIPELNSEEDYMRTHDDCDGTSTGILSVMIDRYGDAYVATDLGKLKKLRFRFPGGGGNSLRVRSALMILAYAIKLDNEEKPQEL
jgi:hypothetical protein